MYSVVLSNGSCIFDSESGFETAVDAMKWSLGRGGSYVAQIANDEVEGAFRSFSISGNRISTYMVYEWINVKLEDVDRFV